MKRSPLALSLLLIALGALGGQTKVPLGSEQINAIEAIAMVGGLSSNLADPTGVFVLRDEPMSVARNVLGQDVFGDQRMAYVLDLTRPNGLFLARDFLIRDGDTVYVTEAPYVQWQKTLGAITGGDVRRLEEATGAPVPPRVPVPDPTTTAPSVDPGGDRDPSTSSAPPSSSSFTLGNTFSNSFASPLPPPSCYSSSAATVDRRCVTFASSSSSSGSTGSSGSSSSSIESAATTTSDESSVLFPPPPQRPSFLRDCFRASIFGRSGGGGGGRNLFGGDYHHRHRDHWFTLKVLIVLLFLVLVVLLFAAEILYEAALRELKTVGGSFPY